MDTFPPEILSLIFTLATDEDVLFHHGLPTSMAASAWFKNIHGAWTLRHPSEALNVLQRRSYATKKSLMHSCKAFHRVASEHMFHCLFFNGPRKLPDLCAILDTLHTDPLPAWWTRRLHVTCYRSKDILDQASAIALCSILRHCPNLEIIVLSIPTTIESFSMIAGTLCTYNKHTLRTLHLSMPVTELSKLIWLLSSLCNLTCAHISFTSPDGAGPDEEDCPILGSAQEIELTLANLIQLSLYGQTGPFVEQASEWNMPSLRFLSLNSVHSDIIVFLDAHGENLVYLDVTCTQAIPMDKVLQCCPKLHTICFNADWTQEGHLAHDHVQNVGIHGLTLAFSPNSGDRTPVYPLDSMIRRANDSNFNSLLAEGCFPKLERVRVLSPNVLTDLERKGGPVGAPPGTYGYTDEIEDGMKRWERWWDSCQAAGVRLEDCTGGELGVLPMDEIEDSESEAEETDGDSGRDEVDSEEDWEDYSWEYEVPPIEDGTSGVDELRNLIEECRQMERERDS